MEKTCSKCKRVLPLNSFGFKDKAKTKILARCKECVKQDKRESYYKHLSKNLDRIRQRKQEYKIAIKQLKDTYRQSGCILCGEKDLACLDFHHIRDKEHTIAAMGYFSTDKIVRELDKCIVLCANCHRKLHYYNNPH